MFHIINYFMSHKLCIVSCTLLFCSGGGDLSVLARGRGLVGGGVEIECFADDRKAFTLTVSEWFALVGGRNFDFWD